MSNSTNSADLVKLATTLVEDGPFKTSPTSRRVRVIHNHTTIVDTIKPILVWEHDKYPQYYVPAKALKSSDAKDKHEIVSNGKVVAAIVELTVPGKVGIEAVTTNRVIRFADDTREELAGLVRLEFRSFDQWLEEDVPIYVHPKDPFKRIDTLQSSRPIEVKVGGKTVAKSSHSVHLFETGLPTRYYLPLASVDQSVLRRSNLITQCPYKGDAEYYHVVVDGEQSDNIVWYYRTPTHESAQIAGLMSFYNEKVDVILNGEILERPKTHFA